MLIILQRCQAPVGKQRRGFFDKLICTHTEHQAGLGATVHTSQVLHACMKCEKE